METICFILLKWGTNKLDSLLFFVPLALLILILGATHLFRFIQHKISEHKEMMRIFEEDKESEPMNVFLFPV